MKKIIWCYVYNPYINQLVFKCTPQNYAAMEMHRFPFCKNGKIQRNSLIVLREKIERFSDLTVDGLLYLAHVSWFCCANPKTVGI